MQTRIPAASNLNSRVGCLLTGAMFLLAGLTVRAAQEEESVLIQISQARTFKERLVWVGDTAPTDAENQTLWTAIEKAHANRGNMAEFEQFIRDYPRSPWTPSIRANLAYYYRDAGRYTLALEDWKAAWESTRALSTNPGKRLGDFTLVNWSLLLSSLGRVDELQELISATPGRNMEDLAWQQAWIRVRSGLTRMKVNPGIAYRCGTYALAQIAEAYTNSAAATELRAIPSPEAGFSLSKLLEFSDKYHLGLVPRRRTSGSDIVVPSVVHWKQSHYAAIIGRQNDHYLVIDPTFGQPRFLSRETINSEASGVFLVPENQAPQGWEPISRTEADSVHGKGLNNSAPLPPPPPCPGPNQDDVDCVWIDPPKCSCGGMATWYVTEPYISLWLHDTPMITHTSSGKVFSLDFFFHQREDRPLSTNGISIFSFGPDWNCNWLNYLDVQDNVNDETNQNFTHFQAIWYGLGGGAITYAEEFTLDSGCPGQVWWAEGSDKTPDPRFHTTLHRLTVTNSGIETLTGFEQDFPNGGKAIYGLLQSQVESSPELLAFPTKQIDPQGRVTRYTYSTNSDVIHLTSVVDWDNNSYGFTYDPTFVHQVSQISDSQGHTVYLKYDANGMLTNIQDVVGINSSFQYTYTNGVPVMTNLRTPYGNTAFSYYRPTADLYGDTDDDVTASNINRAILITQPDGGKHTYLYRDDSSSFLPPSEPDGNYPYDGMCNTFTSYRNSFYWGPRQSALLSTSDLTHFNTNDYNFSRRRNYLHQALETGGSQSVSPSLNMERAPSLDGYLDGQKLWVGYVGKSADAYEGTNAKPSYVVRTLPNGDVRYRHDLHNRWGHPLTSADTFADGSSDRTTTFNYSDDGIDLLQVIGPDGITNVAYAYDTNHDVIFMTNAIGEVTGYTYTNIANANSTNPVLTSIKYPTGLITTNFYDSNGFLTSTYDYAVIGGSTVYYRTNSYTYVNGLVFTHTDERGLTITNSWDALGRLTNVAYPDGTSISYVYRYLDVAQVIDRMGFTNSYAYDSMRRKIAWTNALGNVMRYNYCNCGSLDSTVDALGQTNRFFYDNEGRKALTIYADGYAVTNNYDLLGQITNTVDSAGTSITNLFNNQGLVSVVSNAFGQVAAYEYDLYDRVTNSTDANGVTIGTAYDFLGRISSRSYPDGGVENFGYTFNTSGMTKYTNQLNQVTRYTYDPLGRKTAETNANLEITQFSYAPAGDLLSLTDGKNQTTSWGYDQYGRVTNKVDATTTAILGYAYDPDNRLTNRVSAAKGTTVYKYDAAGNLTNVVYPISPSITLKYDGLNRLTNMLDAVGTTVYSYDAASQLLSEDGPWPDDTVSYKYQNRLRTGLSVSAPNASAWTESYGYDAAERLTSLSSPVGSFSYLLGGTSSASSLIAKLTLPNGAYITNTYDGNARLLSTILDNSTDAALNVHTYTYNPGNQKTQQTFTAGNYTAYGYDNIGQLISANGKESGGTTNRLQEQLTYGYDASHNLNSRTNNALVETFGVNNLNELTAVIRSNTLTVAGTTTSPATNVTVNGSVASLYADSTFALGGFSLVNGTNTFTAIAKDSYGRQDKTTNSVYLPLTNNFTYDSNGNLLSDGTRSFAYDDENQLTSVWVTNVWRSDFVYDGKMRRRIRKEYTWVVISPILKRWVETNEVHYLYDGNLVIQERDTNDLPQITYTRGTDLSGTLQGAGGIGGLLARTDNSQLNTQNSQLASAYYHADGNGNITCLINSNQVVVARYEYDPFGNTLLASGSMADANTYRFSGKDLHVNSGLFYYLYRFYDPVLERWANRDPIGEYGAYNLYDYVQNNPISFVDAFGYALVPGSGGALAAMVKNCIKNGGRWVNIAQMAYGGDMNACIKDFMGDLWPGNMDPVGNPYLWFGLSTLSRLSKSPCGRLAGAVGYAVTAGKAAQAQIALASCSQMFCDGARSPTPVPPPAPPQGPPGPIIIPPPSCPTCNVNNPGGIMPGGN